MTNDEIEEHKIHLEKIIQQHYEQYLKAIKPYMDKLYMLHSISTPPVLLQSLDYRKLMRELERIDPHCKPGIGERDE